MRCPFLVYPLFLSTPIIYTRIRNFQFDCKEKTKKIASPDHGIESHNPRRAKTQKKRSGFENRSALAVMPHQDSDKYKPVKLSKISFNWSQYTSSKTFTVSYS